MGDRIEKLYSRWERGGVDEDEIHVAIDGLLLKARLVTDDDGTTVVTHQGALESDGIHDQRIAILETLADLAGIEPEETGPWYVVQYGVTRHFGGPEEGGWYYDWHELALPVATVETSRQDAKTMCRAMNALAQRDREREGRHQGRNSVLGGEDIVYVVETTVGSNATTERPHYE
jgi:hypothetical protein